MYTPLLPIRTTRRAHHMLDFITPIIFGEEYRPLISSLCSFIQSTVTPSLLGPNILLNTLFSDTLSLRYSLNVSGQVSLPYLTTISGSLSPRHDPSSGCVWRNGLQIWRVSANKLNKRSLTADKGWSSSLGVGWGANNSLP
jgi:hypothetical protein